MLRRPRPVALTLAALATIAPLLRAAGDAPSNTTALRVRFGMKDNDPRDWSGHVDLAGPGKVTTIQGWRWTPGNSADGNEFTVSTRRPPAQSAAERQRVRNGGRLPIAETGIVVTLDGATPQTTVTLTTKPGTAAVTLADLPIGKPVVALNGNMTLERVPAATELAETDADEDYPASAQANDGTLYVAYLAFTHGKDFEGARERPATKDSPPVTGPAAIGAIRKIEKPEDLDYLAEPTGGEQLFLRVRHPDGTWADPLPVTDGKNELYRPAIAVDGAGKVWVFYSAQLNADQHLDHGNWELMARSFDKTGANGSAVLNVSNADGTDFMPAAATDSDGHVHVVWVGARNDHFNIFHSTQSDAEKFSAPARLSEATANEWEPAIATDAAGHLAVAWDTYAKGDYDVYVTTRTNDGAFTKPQPVAATLNFEVRPALAYDHDHDLWIAYEQSGDQWGKDFGGLKKKGIPIYNAGRSLAVRVLTPDGKWLAPPDVMDAMPDYSPGRTRPKRPGTPISRRTPGPAGITTNIAPSYPKLISSPDGNVYLAFRGRGGGNWRTGVGSAWFEYVMTFTPDGWTEAAWLPRSSGGLDVRPALAATDSALTVIYTGDGRGEMNPPKGETPAAGADSPIYLDAAPAANDEGPAPDPGLPPNASATPAADTTPPATQPADELLQRARPGGRRRANAARRAVAAARVNADLFTTTLNTSDFTNPARGGRLSDHLTPIDPPAPAQPSPDTPAEQNAIAAVRAYRIPLNDESLRIWRGEFHRHTEYSFDGGGDGGLLDMWRYAVDAADMDWIGDGDHDYGSGREYSWWTTQKVVTLMTMPAHFTPMFCYERSVSYPEGHRNCMFAQRGVRSLPRLPISDRDKFAPAPDTDLLYVYLHRFNALCAPHTSATDMGTDWRNYGGDVEPFVEIYQGDRNSYERPDAPRTAVTEAKLKQSTPEKEAMGGWEPKGFVNLALKMGRRYAFECSSDHISTHLAYCNVLVAEPTRENILDAVKHRRVYASTDNIIADVRCKAGDKDHLMGEEFATTQPPTLNIHLVGTHPFKKVTIIKDDEEAQVWEPNKQDVTYTWTDPHPTQGKVSYYYVRGEQVPDMDDVSTGELVWASPMWITYRPK